MRLLKELWVRAAALALLSLSLGLAIGATLSEARWTLALAGVTAVAGVGFAVLSLHERPGHE